MNDAEFNSYIESAPDPAPELEGEVKEQETDEKLKVEVKDIPNSSGELEEDGAEIVKKIKRDVLGEPDPETEDEEGGDIPDAFTDACLKQGWTEEEIVEFASDLDDAALLSLIPSMNEQDVVEQKKSESPEGETKQEDKSEATDKTAKPTDEDLAAVKKELKEIKEQIGKADKERNVREEKAMAQAINQAFDEASKEFEIFGKTDELLIYPAGPKKGQLVPTSPAMIARKEVWAKAFPFIQSGIPTKDAMEIALTWYKGKYLEKEVQRNLIKDLKKHETKLSAKRSGKETVKTYENEDERKEAVVREAAREAGVKGEFGVD